MHIKPIKYYWALQTFIRKLWFGHIGNMSYMGPPLSLIGIQNIYIGNKVRIQPGCRMEAHDSGEILIGDNVSIGQNFHCIAFGTLSIGGGTLISGNVFVSDSDHGYSNIGVPVFQQSMIQKDTVIGENCFIGFGAVILSGTRLGRQCIVGANSVLRGSYPDYSVIVGAPGKIVKKYNVESGSWERVRNE